MRDRRQRKDGQDQPWREERRQRYPDERYGVERESRSRADDRTSDRGRGAEPNHHWRAEGSRGADDRGDVAPEGYGESDRMDWNEDRWNRGGSFGFGAEEDIERGGNYAYGSPYGQGDLGSDRPGRGDWNEPKDWRNRDNYAGRGPKDYRRSDDRIREEICDVFTDDARLDPSELIVKVDGAEVTLIGTVTSREQKRRAETLAERIRGVSDVHNQLRVLD